MRPHHKYLAGIYVRLMTNHEFHSCVAKVIGAALKPIVLHAALIPMINLSSMSVVNTLRV